MNILLLEDSDSDVGLIQRELKKANISFTDKVVDSKEEFENALINFNPDVILSDHSLPSFNSIEALNLVKKYNINVPFILVTGTVSEEFAVRSIKEGADDYILKSNLMRLPSSIDHALRTRRAEFEKEKAMQKLIATNKELNTFIYKATHDLRGPLCSIMGLTNIAINEKENVNDYIVKILETTYKLDAILLSLIDVMLIKDAKVELTPVNINELLNAIFKRFKLMDGFDKIKFIVNNNQKSIFHSDERILSLILQKIIENTIKYQNKHNENPQVEISIYEEDTAIKMDILDNGTGIEKQVQERIFEMFTKGTSDSKGSGLGLYLVKNGIEKLGGVIELKSKRGIGTKFSITMPIFSQQ